MAPYVHHDILTPEVIQMPQKGMTLAGEMECYSLPYGGLGFASHILTYYTVIVLSTGRSPFRPWTKLSHSSIDLWLSIIGLVGGVSVGVFTLVRCRNNWELLVIAIWKLSMTLFNGAVGIHISTITREIPKPAKIRGEKDISSSFYRPLVDMGFTDDDKEQTTIPNTGSVWMWIFLYIPGMIAGFAGLVSLIIHNWSAHSKLHTITYVFGGVFGFFMLHALYLAFNKGVPEALVGAIFTSVTFATFAALYGDWALGAMTNNLLGAPSADATALYWSYMFLKRLTMFSL